MWLINIHLSRTQYRYWISNYCIHSATAVNILISFTEFLVYWCKLLPCLGAWMYYRIYCSICEYSETLTLCLLMSLQNILDLDPDKNPKLFDTLMDKSMGGGGDMGSEPPWKIICGYRFRYRSAHDSDSIPPPPFSDLTILNPLCAYGFSSLVWYNKLGMFHCICLGVTGYDFQMTLYFFFCRSFLS